MPPKKVVQYSDLDPTRGLAALLQVMPLPHGYCFESMKRDGTNATVTYVKIRDKKTTT